MGTRRAVPGPWLAAALILIFCGVTLSCRSKTALTESPSQEASLTIGYSRLRISLPVFVAQQKGIFSRHGIKANLVMYDTAQPMMQALVEGKIDIAGYTAYPITYSAIARSHKALYFITVMVEDQQHRISFLLRPKPRAGESPRIKTIRDLKGKRVGILPTIAYKAWLQAIVKANGIDPADVQIIQVDPALESQALKSGGVDALFTNDPAATAAIDAGIAELISDKVECPEYIKNPFPFGSFNVSKAWADANRDALGRLLAALDDAVGFINANPQAAKDSMKPYMPEQFRADVDRYPDAKYLASAETTDAMLQEMADLYLKMGIIDAHLDLTGLVARGH